MPLILSRARASGRAIDLGRVSRFGRPVSAGARPRSTLWNKPALSSRVTARRHASNDAEVRIQL